MHFNYLALGVPLFLGFMLLEYYYAKSKGHQYFKLHNSIANICIGIAERMADVLLAGAFYFVYDYIQKHYGIFTIRSGVAVWLLLFLLTDLIWYWYHRLAHEVNVLWMAHVVHHQSEDFNYTVSARITVFQALARTLFWCVLPLIGFPAPMVTSLLLLHGIYPFFIHTRTIGKLGILEYLLVTPSHHRVHHASNEKYLDKNYGDVLIIWDKLFGTFQKEEKDEIPVYGLTKPLNTYSFLWQHFHFVVELWLAVKKEKNFFRKLKILFGKPDTLHPHLREEAEKIFLIQQSQDRIDQPLNKYVIIQVLAMLLGLFLFTAWEEYFSATFKTGFSLLVLLTLINCGAIMEQKRWVFQVELIRLSLLSLVPFFYPQYPIAKFVVLACVVVLLAIYYRSAKGMYLSYVYRSKPAQHTKHKK